MSPLRPEPWEVRGLVQVDEVNPEIILGIGVMKCAPARFLVLFGDAVHAHYAGGGEVIVERLWRSLKI